MPAFVHFYGGDVSCGPAVIVNRETYYRKLRIAAGRLLKIVDELKIILT